MFRSDYLRFGGSEQARALAVEETIEFLARARPGRNSFTTARERAARQQTEPFRFEPLGVNYCDFCFAQLMGGEYDRLADGRERCVRCSVSVIRTNDEFVAVYSDTRSFFEMAFGTTINVAVRVRMVNAREIAKKTGESFYPTPGVDARVLGFASHGSQGYSLYLENGAPALAVITTMAHELTHIWQFINWNENTIATRYGQENRLVVSEGMATWAMIQYLICVGEVQHAQRQKAYALLRDDEYGAGFRLFCERYPLDWAGAIGHRSPFHQQFPL